MNRIATLACATLSLAALLSVGCAGLPPLLPFASEGPDSETPQRGVALHAGVRDFTGDGAFGDTEAPRVGGLELFWNLPGEALAWEVALLHAYDSEDLPASREVEVQVSELQFGLRYQASPTRTLKPYLGGGLALLYARSNSSAIGLPTEREEEWDAALYAHAGVWAPLGPDLRLGCDLRWLTGDWLGAGDLDLDHTQLSVTVGTGF